jgi:lysozyme
MAIDVTNKRKIMAWLLGAGSSIAIAISGAFLVAPNESAVNKTYIDPVGLITSCLGHTSKDLKLGQTFTDIQCMDQFAKDLSKANAGVHEVIHVPLTVYQEAALTSFTYNVGVTNLRKSTLAKEFNAGDYTDGCNELIKWVYAGNTKLRGLEIRREQERQMCLGKMEWLDAYNN